jgi:hypothetical protein
VVLETGISLYRRLAEGSFSLDFERQMKEGSGDGTPLSKGVLRGERKRRYPLLGTLKDIKEISGNGRLSL